VSTPSTTSNSHLSVLFTLEEDNTMDPSCDSNNLAPEPVLPAWGIALLVVGLVLLAIAIFLIVAWRSKRLRRLIRPYEKRNAINPGARLTLSPPPEAQSPEPFTRGPEVPLTEPAGDDASGSSYESPDEEQAASGSGSPASGPGSPASDEQSPRDENDAESGEEESSPSATN